MKNKIVLKKDTLYLIPIGILLILIAGFRPIGIDGDSLNYASVLGVHIENANFIDKEPMFWIINEINHIFFNSEIQIFFLLFAILGVSLKIYSIKKLAIYPLMSIFVYISFYFILHEMTQIRVGIASAIFLLAISSIINRDLKIYLFLTLIATLFHYSAIIMIFIYLLNTIKINQVIYILLPLLGIFSSLFQNMIIYIITSITLILPAFIADKINLYIILLRDGKFNDINIFNFYYLSLILLYYVIIFNYKKFTTVYDILYIKIFSIMLFLFYFLSAIPVLAFRVSEFYGVILVFLIPNFVAIFKEKYLIRTPMIIWLSIYFFVIMVMRNLNLQ